MILRSKRLINKINKWRVDLNNLLYKYNNIFVSINLIIYNEILLIKYNNSLNNYFNVRKILILLY